MIIAHKLSSISILTTLIRAETLFIKASETISEYWVLNSSWQYQKLLGFTLYIHWCTSITNFDKYNLYFQEFARNHRIPTTESISLHMIKNIYTRCKPEIIFWGGLLWFVRKIKLKLIYYFLFSHFRLARISYIEKSKF